MLNINIINKTTTLEFGLYLKSKKLLNGKKRPFIGIAISAGNKLKAIPVEKWIEILDNLQKEINGTIFLLGNQKDFKIAQTITEYLILLK